MNASDFDCYGRSGYFTDLADRADQAGQGDNITVMSMGFGSHLTPIERLAHSLAGAAKRGANVRLVIDAMDFIQDQVSGRFGPLFYKRPLTNSSHKAPFDHKFALLEEIRKAGGHYSVINQPSRIFPFQYANRSHIKLAIINQRVYVGGINLDTVDYVDQMVAWEDAATAEWLSGIVDAITAEGNVRRALKERDQTFTVNSSLELFIDSGVKNQSIIFDQAMALIDSAQQRVFITCQYFPGGRTARHLKAAHNRGVAVEIIFNHPSRHRQAASQKFWNWLHRWTMPRHFFNGMIHVEKPKLHSKLITTEAGAIAGSNNYVDIGVRFGTAEIAMRTSDPTLAAKLEAHIKDQFEEA